MASTISAFEMQTLPLAGSVAYGLLDYFPEIKLVQLLIDGKSYSLSKITRGHLLLIESYSHSIKISILREFFIENFTSFCMKKSSAAFSCVYLLLHNPIRLAKFQPRIDIFILHYPLLLALEFWT